MQRRSRAVLSLSLFLEARPLIPKPEQLQLHQSFGGNNGLCSSETWSIVLSPLILTPFR